MNPLTISVASGKGGTGKTTISLSLASFMARNGCDVAVLDCDVEEPNVNLFLRAPIERSEQVATPVPAVDAAACTGCGRCEEICAFSAIVLIKGIPLVIPDMCHSCGGCVLVCPERALIETGKNIGVIESGRAGTLGYAGGRLDIGAHMSPPLIREVKKMLPGAEVRIIDCPPGTSCPVIEAVRGSDFLVLVTEPTPFGLNDLRLAVDMARALGLPFGVVINKDGTGTAAVEHWCAAEGIGVLARIPDVRRIAEEYSKGDCVTYILDNYSAGFGFVVGLIVETDGMGVRT
jgi:MinD superfamily P-loop ATPase